MKLLGLVIQNKKGQNIVIASAPSLPTRTCVVYSHLIYEHILQTYRSWYLMQAIGSRFRGLLIWRRIWSVLAILPRIILSMCLLLKLICHLLSRPSGRWGTTSIGLEPLPPPGWKPYPRKLSKQLSSYQVYEHFLGISIHSRNRVQRVHPHEPASQLQ